MEERCKKTWHSDKLAAAKGILCASRKEEKDSTLSSTPACNNRQKEKDLLLKPGLSQADERFRSHEGFDQLV